MSVAIIDNNAVGTGPRIRRVFPVMTGLALVAYMDTDLVTATRNQVARGSTAGVPTGSPAFSSSHVSLSGTVKIDYAALAETDYFTIITTMKPTGDLTVANGRPAVAGWFNNNMSPKGAYLSINSATNLRAELSYLVGGVPTESFMNISSYAAGELLTERLVALSVYSGGATLYDLTKGVQASITSANARSNTAANGFRLGANFNTTGTGSIDMSKTLLFQGIGLTKPQIDQVVVPIRAYLLDVNGITV